MKPAFILILLIAAYGVTLTGFWVTNVKTMTIYPSADSYAWQSIPNANNGGSDNFEITSYVNAPKNMRGWMRFNLSAMPSDAWILTAKLRLRIWHKTTDDSKQGTGDSTGRIYGAYRVTLPWKEYNITWANQPNYTDDHHATAAVPPGQGGWNGPVLWMEWDLTDMVKDWRAGASNYGILVRDTQENATTLYSTQFFTHDKVTIDKYPRLVVSYVTPQGIALLSTLLIVEGLFIVVLGRRKISRIQR